MWNEVLLNECNIGGIKEKVTPYMKYAWGYYVT